MTDQKGILNKRALAVIAVLVLAVIGYFLIQPQSSDSQDVAGTMGTVDEGVQRAQKYRADQMTEADVVLKDAQFQDLLQNDVVQKMLKNGDFQAMAADGRLTALVTCGFVDPVEKTGVANFVQSSDYKNLVQNKVYLDLCKVPNFGIFLIDKNVNGFVAKGQLQQVVNSKAFTQLVNSPGFKENNLTSEKVQQLLESKTFQNVINGAIANSLLDNPKTVGLVTDMSVMQIVSSNQFAALNKQGLVGLLGNEKFASLVQSKTFLDLAKNGGLDKLVGDNQKTSDAN